MIQPQERGTEAWWTETGAEEWADAIVAAMKLGGVEHLFFVSGSELTFYQASIAKANAKGRPAFSADDPRARGPQCRSGERHGTEPAGGHGSACGRRDLALRRRDPHCLARWLSCAHDRRHRATGLSRLDAGCPWQQCAVGPGTSRPGRDRAPVHQARPSPGTPGQPRTDDQSTAPGCHERTQRPGLREHSARDRDAAHARLCPVPYPGPAWPGPAGLA